MKIALDLTALMPQATGVDTYLWQLATALGRLDDQNRYIVFVNYEDRGLFVDLLPDNFRIWPLCFRLRLARLGFQQVMLPALVEGLGVDVVHSPSFLRPFFRGRQRHLVTTYDMTFFSLPQCHTPLHRSATFRRAVLWSIRGAHLVSVPSRATRQHILDLMPDVPEDRIRVVSPGVGDEFRPQPPELVRETLARLGVPSPYLLYVGTFEPRKNLDRLVEAYERLVSETGAREHLVLAGRLGWGYESLLARLEAPALRNRVHRLGYVLQADLPKLYAGATLFVYPSLQEGFGFPPLEAMACGVPVVASHGSSLIETLDGAADLVPATDVAALSGALARMVRDEGHRKLRSQQGMKRAASHRWGATARDTLACYEFLAESRSASTSLFGLGQPRKHDPPQG